ncbi:unnamed protein product [Linum tenue]|uniref:SET domain-containing protein n=1 Tax=Linum tenue TaxID=586396 RepID=A0AAV0IXE2_9ROSI|nr:unnamed protein product [Linum tenue]
MQELRLKASELLLREEWHDSVQVYTQFITLCRSHIEKHPPPLCNSPHLTKIQRSLCLGLSNRAEAHFRLRDPDKALRDCNQALEIEPTHYKSLLGKGRILFALNRYSAALLCFKSALLEDPQSNETLNGYIEKCKKLESLSRTGAFDLTDWILNGFRGKTPELAEYVGAVKIKRSEELSGRGLFATKNMDAGTLVLVTKAIATERCILSNEEEDSAENAQLVMWKSFIDQVSDSAAKCTWIRRLISTLSPGDDEASLEIPETELFKGELTEECGDLEPDLSSDDLLNILDVNSLVEDSVSAKVLGKNSDYYGVGLWVLASFINHSCIPNSRRLHVGDYVMVHLSKDVKAGEELTFSYFDVLLPLEKRKEMSQTWGFSCHCRRCRFEEGFWADKQELKEIEMMGLGKGKGMVDFGGVIFRIEEAMKRWNVRGREKGYLRASFWGVYEDGYASVKRWGRRIPASDVVVESVAEAVGSDERLLKVLMRDMTNMSGVLEIERAMKLGKGVYGKVVKKKLLRSLIGVEIQEQKVY